MIALAKIKLNTIDTLLSSALKKNIYKNIKENIKNTIELTELPSIAELTAEPITTL